MDGKCEQRAATKASLGHRLVVGDVRVDQWRYCNAHTQLDCDGTKHNAALRDGDLVGELGAVGHRLSTTPNADNVTPRVSTRASYY